LLGILALYLILKKIQSGDKIICLILSIFWIWIGGVYHLLFFTTINKAAYVFGTLFILQGILFIIFGVIKPVLSFQFKIDRNGLFGIVFLTYAGCKPFCRI
jgi:hypothetical protein